MGGEEHKGCGTGHGEGQCRGVRRWGHMACPCPVLQKASRWWARNLSAWQCPAHQHAQPPPAAPRLLPALLRRRTGGQLAGGRKHNWVTGRQRRHLRTGGRAEQRAMNGFGRPTFSGSCQVQDAGLHAPLQLGAPPPQSARTALPRPLACPVCIACGPSPSPARYARLAAMRACRASSNAVRTLGQGSQGEMGCMPGGVGRSNGERGRAAKWSGSGRGGGSGRGSQFQMPTNGKAGHAL